MVGWVVIVRVDVVVAVIEVGLQPAIIEGELVEVVSATGFVNPPCVVIEIVDVPCDPALIVRVEGALAKVKSGGITGAKLVVTGLPRPVTKSYPGLAEYAPFEPLVMSRRYEG